MKILIFGCGYVGKAVASLLFAQGYFVGVTTRNLQKIEDFSYLSHEVHHLTQNVNYNELLSKYDTIIFSVAADNSQSYQDSYLNNAQIIVEALKNQPRRQLIYTSSTSVYGDHEGAWVNEQSDLKPMNPQATILVATEKKFLELSDKHAICILRLGEIIGPGREIESRVRRLQGTVLPGNGLTYTNFSPLEDIVNGICFAITHKIEGLFNLCTSQHLQRKELYDQIARENHLDLTQWNPEEKSVHGGNKKVSSEKIISLGFKFSL